MNQAESSSLLFEQSMIASIYSVCMMRSEENALLYHPEVVDDKDAAKNGPCRQEGEEKEEPEGGDALEEEVLEMTYMELQYGFEAIAVQLHFRFGVHAHDMVLVACEGCAPAELLACTACLRLGAPFVPMPITLPPSPRSHVDEGGGLSRVCSDAWEALLADVKPVAAIVVASSEESPVARALRAMGVHRLLLLLPDGSLAPCESEWTASLPDMSTIPLPPHRPVAALQEEEEDGEEGEPLLYVLFTSGSSSGGRAPKGVRGTQQGLLNRLAWQFRRFPFSLGASGWADEGEGEDEWEEKEKKEEGECEGARAASVVCRRTPLTSVDAVVELFGPLLAGVPLYAPPAAVLRRGDALQLAALAGRQQVTHCTLLPSQLDQLCALLRRQQSRLSSSSTVSVWPSLQVMYVSGEACGRHVIEGFYGALTPAAGGGGRLLGSSATRLVNLYGSTEVAGDVCYAELTRRTCEGGAIVPIGSEIIPGNVLYIARRREREPAVADTSTMSDRGTSTGGRLRDMGEFEAVADGEEGELLVGGAQVCRGYLGAAAGSGKFISNPFASSPSSSAVCLGPAKSDAGAPPAVVYCTGDVVRVDEEQGGRVLRFLRRCDAEDQTVFKLRGGARVCVEAVARAVQATLEAIASPTPRGANVPCTATSAHASRSSTRVVVTVAAQKFQRAGHDIACRDVLVACVHADLLKLISVDAITGEVVASSDERSASARGGSGSHMRPLYDYSSEHEHDFTSAGMRVAGLSSTLRRALLQAVRKGACDLSSPLHLPALFFPVEAFSMTTLPGKYNRANFRKQVQLWADQYCNLGYDQQQEQGGGGGGGRAKRRRRWLDRDKEDDDGEDEGEGEGEGEHCRSCVDRVVHVVLQVLPWADRQLVAAAARPSSSSPMSFFALGGDSMSAIEAVWLLKSSFADPSASPTPPSSEAINDLLAGPMHMLATTLCRHASGCRDQLASSGNDTAPAAPTNKRARAKNSSVSAGLRVALVCAPGCSAEPAFHWFGKAGSSSLGRQHASAASCTATAASRDAPPSDVKLTMKWRCAFSKCIDATPLLVLPSSAHSTCSAPGGFLFAGSHNGEVACVDKESGRKLWQRLVGSQHHFEGAMCYDASLAVEQVGLAALTCSGAAAGGNSPEGPSGVVFASSYWGRDIDGAADNDNHEQGGEEGEGAHERSLGRVWALSACSGELLWHSLGLIAGEVKGSPVVLHLACPAPSAPSAPSRVSEPVPVSVLCVGAQDGCLYALNALTGRLLGRLQLDGGGIFATPAPLRVEESRGSLLVATTGGRVVCVELSVTRPDVETGGEAGAVAGEAQLRLAVRWSHGTALSAPVFASPVVFACPPQQDQRQRQVALLAVCCTVGGEVVCLDASSGDVVWSLSVAASPAPVSSSLPPPKASPVFSSPCVFPLLLRHASLTAAASGQPVELLREDVGLAFGCHDGQLRFVSALLGRVIWSVPLRGAIFSSPAVVSVAASRGNIAFVATTCGNIFVLSVPSVFDESGAAAPARVLDCLRLPGEVYSSPVVVAPPSSSAVYAAVGCRDDSVYAFSLEV